MDAVVYNAVQSVKSNTSSLVSRGTVKNIQRGSTILTVGTNGCTSADITIAAVSSVSKASVRLTNVGFYSNYTTSSNITFFPYADLTSTTNLHIYGQGDAGSSRTFTIGWEVIEYY